VRGIDDDDEKYNRANVEKVVATGEWRPSTRYYSFLSWAPQAALLAGIDRLQPANESPRRVRFGPGRPSRFVLDFLRGVQAVYGTALVLVVYWLARDLSGRAAGLLGAALASSSWLYVWAGAWFKPDGVTALAFGLAVLWSVRAIQHPTPLRYALAGVGVGLATSAKFTAVVAAVPLALATPFLARTSRRRWRDAALAVAASLGVFFLTAPYWRANLHATRGVLRDYAWRAGEEQSSYLGVLADIYWRLLDSLHGPLWWALFWLAVLALAVPAVGGALAPAQRLSLRVVVATVLLAAPVMLVLARAPFLRSNNVFPALVLATVVASVAAAEIWRRAADRWSALRRPVVAWSAGLLAVAIPVAEGSRWLYARAVPTTEDLALTSLYQRMPMRATNAGLRTIFHERVGPGALRWDGQKLRETPIAVYFEVDRLAEVDEARLGRADAELFLASRLRGPERDFYLARRNAARRAEQVRPQFLRSRGPNLVLLVHPWRAASRQLLPPLPSDSGTKTVFRLPDDLAADQPISFVVLPSASGDSPQALRLDGREIALHLPSRATGKAGGRLLSERVSPSAGALVELVTTGSGAAPRVGAPARVELWIWIRSSADALSSAAPAAASTR
jgi:hypothetical protein